MYPPSSNRLTAASRISSHLGLTVHLLARSRHVLIVSQQTLIGSQEGGDEVGNRDPGQSCAADGGARAGLGLELARELAAKGARLAIAARRRERPLEELADEIARRGGIAPAVLEVDLCRRGAAATRCPPLEAVAAPLGGDRRARQQRRRRRRGRIAVVGDDDVAREAPSRVNYWSPLALLHVLAPAMGETAGGAAVVNVTSMALHGEHVAGLRRLCCHEGPHLAWRPETLPRMELGIWVSTSWRSFPGRWTPRSRARPGWHRHRANARSQRPRQTPESSPESIVSGLERGRSRGDPTRGARESPTSSPRSKPAGGRGFTSSRLHASGRASRTRE